MSGIAVHMTLPCLPLSSQVVVATAATCWGMKCQAHLVVVMGTQAFDATGTGSSDYPITDLLQVRDMGTQGKKELSF